MLRPSKIQRRVAHPRHRLGVLRRNDGQAAVEMAFSLPLLIWLTYYVINAYYAMHTNHTAQKYAAMGMYQRLDNRAKFVVDGVENKKVDRAFIAVQYTDPEGKVPLRKITVGPMKIINSAGVCREPDCN